MPTIAHHSGPLRDLVEFTASSLDTAFPSPFGSSIYDGTGTLLAQAYDTVLSESDPTNHAEMNAIREAAQNLKSLSLGGCTLYSTCEPCPMCMSACIWAEIETVVYGASTLEDADRYWPQASAMSPGELVSRMRHEPRCQLIANVERARCQDLFERSDEVRRSRGLPMPPRR